MYVRVREVSLAIKMVMATAMAMAMAMAMAIAMAMVTEIFTVYLKYDPSASDPWGSLRMQFVII